MTGGQVVAVSWTDSYSRSLEVFADVPAFALWLRKEWTEAGTDSAELESLVTQAVAALGERSFWMFTGSDEGHPYALENLSYTVGVKAVRQLEPRERALPGNDSTAMAVLQTDMLGDAVDRVELTLGFQPPRIKVRAGGSVEAAGPGGDLVVTWAQPERVPAGVWRWCLSDDLAVIRGALSSAAELAELLDRVVRRPDHWEDEG